MRIIKSFSIDEEIFKLLREYSDKTGIPASKFVEMLLKNALLNEEDNNGYTKSV